MQVLGTKDPSLHKNSTTYPTKSHHFQTLKQSSNLKVKMKVTGLFTVLATALAVTATAIPDAAPDAVLEDRASVSFNRAEAAALRSQTQSTINQIRNIQRSYENRARGTIGDWKGSAKTSIQRDLSNFDAAIKKSNDALNHIVATLNRLL